jgi:hypothetical protein
MKHLLYLAACLFLVDIGVAGVGCDAPQTYCTAKVASSGCQPRIGYAGTPGADNFVITAQGVSRGRIGILFLGRARAEVPFNGGTLCTSTPTKRIAPQFATTGIQCSALLAFPFGRDRMQRFGVNTEDTLFAQVFFRDPDQSDLTGVGLTDGLEIKFCP